MISARQCRKNVGWKDSVTKFMNRSEENCEKLLHELETNTYKLSQMHEFDISERGKTRHIVSLNFRDRVINKILNQKVLKPIFESAYISNNFASQKGKGPDLAHKIFRRDLIHHIQTYGVNHTYVYKIDAKSYFSSISHEYIKSVLRELIDDPRILKLLYMILSSYYDTEIDGKYYGVNLGSETNQTYGLLCLHNIDIFVTEELGIKEYYRFMDDIFIIHHDKYTLHKVFREISNRLCDGIHINENKTTLNRITKGCNFLKFHYYAKNTGKLIVLPSKEKIRFEKRKLKKQKENYLIGKKQLDTILHGYLSWRESLRFADNYAILKSMDDYFANLFKEELHRNDMYSNGKYRFY